MFDNGVAFVNEFMYLRANVRETGSFISITVASSGCNSHKSEEKKKLDKLRVALQCKQISDLYESLKRSLEPLN